jgi:hypothetical protein
MNVSLTIEQTKWFIDSKNYKEALDLAQNSITYLANQSREHGNEFIVPAYLPIFGEWIMTRSGKQKRVLRYDKKETKSVDYWKERFWELYLSAEKKYKRQQNKLKKQELL